MKQPGRSTNPMTAIDNGSGYSFGYNGKEQDFNFHLADGQIYDFSARIYDARLGRWLSRDPAEKKYPFMSPYAAMGLNPIIFTDMSGATLEVAGKINQALIDARSIVPANYQPKIAVIDNKIVFNVSQEEAQKSGDLGVMLLYGLVNSDRKYLSKVSDEPIKNGSLVGIEGTSNIGPQLSIKYPEKEKVKYIDSDGKVKTKVQLVEKEYKSFNKAPDGYDASRTIFDDDYKEKSPGNERPSVIMHELSEMYKMTEGKGMPYGDAHKGAIDDANKLPVGDERRGATPGQSTGIEPRK